MATKGNKRLVFITALAIAGCQGGDGGGTDVVVPAEDGVYSYVLGIDGETGEPIYGGSHKVMAVNDRGKEEAIDSPNTPSRLHPQLREEEYKTYDAAVSSGESDWDVFASSWWAQSNNGIAKRWTGGSKDYSEHDDVDNLSPTEKYDLLFNPGQSVDVSEVSHWSAADMRKPVSERGDKHSHDAITALGPATAWELKNHGNYQTRSHPDSWWGHCNGWASYATAEPRSYPSRDVKIKLVDGAVKECVGELEGDPDCVLFRLGDVEALMTELYFSDQATFAGRRCNTDPDKMERDEFGRPTEAACRDLNAGAFHIGVTGLLSRGAKHFVTGEVGKPAFVIDHNFDWEVWNFPLVRFQIDETDELSVEQANEALGAAGSDYEFNSRAVRFVKVRMRYWMVSDGVSDSKMLLPADERNVASHETELRYILEIDADDEIIGGEWLKVPSYSWSEKEIHPDFYWMAKEHNGWGEDSDDLGGSNDNPYIAYSKVAAILDCANDADSCAPGEAPPPPQGFCTGHCGGSASENGQTCWCDDLCESYGDCCSDKQAACDAM